MAAGQVVLIAAERRLLAWLQQRGIMPRLFVRRAATLVRRPASHVPSCVVAVQQRGFAWPTGAAGRRPGAVVAVPPFACTVTDLPFARWRHLPGGAACTRGLSPLAPEAASLDQTLAAQPPGFVPQLASPTSPVLPCPLLPRPLHPQAQAVLMATAHPLFFQPAEVAGVAALFAASMRTSFAALAALPAQLLAGR